MELAVASGKGGTGKTFVSSSLLYYLAKIRGVEALGVDGDAEAPDLVLACGGEARVLREELYAELYVARIDRARCTKCLRCINACAFDAIALDSDGYPTVDEYLCEGCGACALVCPARCVSLEPRASGVVKIVETKLGLKIVSSEIIAGSRATGHVVYRARELAKEMNPEMIVVDSAAGIGCAVISSIVGVDILILVVEPLPPSIEGARRMVELGRRMGLKMVAIVNKHDLNEEASRKIGEELGIEVVGRVPYDAAVVESYAHLQPVLHRSPESRAAKALLEIFSSLVG